MWSTPIQKTALFACFRFLFFSSIYPGGQLTPFAPMCGRPCLFTRHFRLALRAARETARCHCIDYGIDTIASSTGLDACAMK